MATSLRPLHRSFSCASRSLRSPLPASLLDGAHELQMWRSSAARRTKAWNSFQVSAAPPLLPSLHGIYMSDNCPAGTQVMQLFRHRDRHDVQDLVEARWYSSLAPGSGGQCGEGASFGFKPELPEKPDEYKLCLGKITDTLRSDYPDFFERSPDFDIYDEQVTLELGTPLEESKVLATGKGNYCRVLMTIRRLASGMVRNGNVTCQVCDGRSYGCALRVYWTCTGQVWLGSSRDFQISAVSYYSLSPQVRSRGEAVQLLTHRIQKHYIDIKEIHPTSLRNRLLSLFSQAEPEPSLAGA